MSRGRISSDFLQKIKDAVNIVDVVGEHVVLRKSGANYSGLCPFHNERSPSFSVSAQKQLYHCYGCKRGGDLFTFVMELHGVTFPEAVEELAERGRVSLPKDWGDGGDSNDPEAEKRRRAAREKIATAHKLNRFVAAFYHQNLAKSAEVQEYFRRRGVGQNEVRSFYTGLAPSGWEGLSQHLASKKAPIPLAVELGLIRPSTKAQAGGLGYFDLFRHRAMFPILDLKGKIVGFGGRTLPGEGSGPGDPGPKYMNSPESPIFQKGKVAFGLFQAQKHVRETRTVILVEGYFDVVALHAAGFENVVATCGTSLTPDHLALFKRVSERVIILFDGDKAGIAATERAMEIGLEQGMVLHGAAMPEGLDPDEILFDQQSGRALDEGKARMKEILDAAKPILDTRINDAVELAGQGPEARTQSLKQISNWLSRLKDPIGRDVRIEELRKRLDLPPALLEKLLPGARSLPPRAAASRNRPAPRKGGAPVRQPTRAATARDKTLLSGLLQGRGFVQHFDRARGNLPPGEVFSSLWEYQPLAEWVSQVISRLSSAEEAASPPNSPNLSGFKTQAAATDFSRVEDRSLRDVLTEVLMADSPVTSEEDFRLALDQRMGKIWARFSQRIRTALADAEAKKDAGLQSRLMEEYLDVQRKMKEFTSFYDEA